MGLLNWIAAFPIAHRLCPGRACLHLSIGRPALREFDQYFTHWCSVVLIAALSSSSKSSDAKMAGSRCKHHPAPASQLPVPSGLTAVLQLDQSYGPCCDLALRRPRWTRTAWGDGMSWAGRAGARLAFSWVDADASRRW
ncbi:hypothetical protein MN608_08402 [Microdochium nivale]|nr:hypothetical protein MN608_08402 [Microdochium nivale]